MGSQRSLGFYAGLGGDDVHAGAVGGAGGLAILQQQGLAAGFHTRGGACPLCGDAGLGTGGSGERASRNSPGIGLLHCLLSGHLYALVWDRGLRLAAVQAEHRRALMEQIAWHHVTSSAWSLIFTVGPESLMVAPLPLSISTAVAVSLIFWPLVVSMVMPSEPF